jgi:hypothetical protein
MAIITANVMRFILDLTGMKMALQRALQNNFSMHIALSEFGKACVNFVEPG